MSFDVKYVKKSWLAHEPNMATSGSAGCDLFSAEEKRLKPHSVSFVSVHLQIEIPPGYYGRILPRSGLAYHHFIDVGGGAICSDFRGELIVIIFNHSNKPYEVKASDRIAKIVSHCYEIPSFVMCDELSKTGRRLGQFGSTVN